MLPFALRILLLVSTWASPYSSSPAWFLWWLGSAANLDWSIRAAADRHGYQATAESARGRRCGSTGRITTDFEQSLGSKPAVAILASILNPHTYKVAAVTIANRGDNIGIYLPLFASSQLFSLAVVLSVFFLLVGVWCYIAYRLARQPAVADVLSRYGEALVPFVFIGLGIFILLESGTYRLVIR